MNNEEKQIQIERMVEFFQSQENNLKNKDKYGKELIKKEGEK